MRLAHYLGMTLILVIASPTVTRAAEWSAVPDVSLRTGYNDNIRLTSADHDSVWETSLSPSIGFGVKTETSELKGDAGFAVRRYYGGDGLESSKALNREDYHFRTDAHHNTELSYYAANIEYRRDSTLDSELDQTGNVIDDRATREDLSLGPSWTRALTERTQLELAYDYTNVDYSDDPGIDNLVSYEYHSGNATLVHSLTSRIQGTVTAGITSFQPSTDFDSETVSLQTGLSANFSETLTASFLIGTRQTTSDSFVGTGFCIGAGSNTDYPACTGGIAVPSGTANTEIETSSAVYSASITKKLEAGSLVASLSRASSPGGNGELLDTTRLLLSGIYKITEKLQTTLKIEYAENETIVSRVGNAPQQDKQTFFRITPRVAWRWRKEWELGGEYQYAENDDPLVAQTATRNAVYMTVNYRPTGFSLSR